MGRWPLGPLGAAARLVASGEVEMWVLWALCVMRGGHGALCGEVCVSNCWLLSGIRCYTQDPMHRLLCMCLSVCMQRGHAYLTSAW